MVRYSKPVGQDYQYMEPGTHLKKRLKCGDPGINRLDRIAKQHDIDYGRAQNLQDKWKADTKMIKTIDRLPGNKTMTERIVKRIMEAKKRLKLSLNNSCVIKTFRKCSLLGRHLHERIVQTLGHALVQMGTVRQNDAIGIALSIKHTQEPLALRATLVATGLDHTVTCRYLFILLAHFQEII